MFEICAYNDCTGCSACASICPHCAINMVADEWGFRHPIIDEARCVQCGACIKVCPAINKPARKERLDAEEFYAAYHKDEIIRMQSSSGGAFSALAKTVLQKKGIVCAAAFDSSCQIVRHIIIEEESQLRLLRTSKYTQSEMGDCFIKVREHLQNRRVVLFVGTPCQTSGLHLYLKKEYPNLITSDIVCHGVPAPRIYKDYINWLQHRYDSQVISYNFRDKRWSWFHFNMRADFSNGKIYYGTWEGDPFFRGFLNDYFLRECCYNCQFSKHYRYADITLSDFWGYDSKDGGFVNDDKGISMCMCNTSKGLSLFNEAKAHLIYCSRPREMSLANGGFKPREQNLEGRLRFLNHYAQHGFKGCIVSHFTPLPIKGQLKILYKYGRDSYILKLSIYSLRFIRLPRRILSYIKRKIFKLS